MNLGSLKKLGSLVTRFFTKFPKLPKLLKFLNLSNLSNLPNLPNLSNLSNLSNLLNPLPLSIECILGGHCCDEHNTIHAPKAIHI